MKGSKNNIKNRGAAAMLKTVGGKVVEPVKFFAAKGGSFMAAKFKDTNNLHRDSAGKPIPYDSIQST